MKKRIVKDIDCLTVKGFERTQPNRFKVVTECDGECFDQSYAKRLNHSFSFKDKYFYEHSDGEFEIIKKIRKIYVEGGERSLDRRKESKEARNKCETVSDKDEIINVLNNEFTGYVIE